MKKEETLETETVNSKEEKKNKKENKKDKQIQELQNQIEELKNKNIRVTADMVNTIRRKDEENQRMMKYANESLILELLSILDNFERALTVNDEVNAELSSYQEGIKMIYNSLKNILDKYEVKEIEADGVEFDPSFHQAVMQVEDKEKASNIVIEVMQKGYTYKDKVIRPAMVKVNK